MTETRTITYEGDQARAGALVQMLEQQGVHVDWQPGREERSFGTDVGAVALSLVASGLYDGIKTGVARFRERFPRFVVVIVGDDEPYQLGCSHREEYARGERLHQKLYAPDGRYDGPLYCGPAGARVFCREEYESAFLSAYVAEHAAAHVDPCEDY
jgi:hypothetical protein